MAKRRRSKTVPDRLKSLGKIHQQRGAVYGDDYKQAGRMYAAIFPRGLTLTTPEEFRRMGMFVHMAAKVARYGQNITRGGHADSLDDISVYAQMLRETDDE